MFYGKQVIQKILFYLNWILSKFSLTFINRKPYKQFCINLFNIIIKIELNRKQLSIKLSANCSSPMITSDDHDDGGCHGGHGGDDRDGDQIWHQLFDAQYHDHDVRGGGGLPQL